MLLSCDEILLVTQNILNPSAIKLGVITKKLSFVVKRRRESTKIKILHLRISIFMNVMITWSVLQVRVISRPT